MFQSTVVVLTLSVVLTNRGKLFLGAIFKWDQSLRDALCVTGEGSDLSIGDLFARLRHGVAVVTHFGILVIRCTWLEQRRRLARIASSDMKQDAG